MKHHLFFLVGFLSCFAVSAQEFHSVLPVMEVQSISIRTKDPDTVQASRDSDSLLTRFKLALKQSNQAQKNEQKYIKHNFRYLPLKDLRLNSSFGYRTHPITGKHAFHAGVDLAAHTDTVFSVLHGIVTESEKKGALGNYVTIRHGKTSSAYGHLSRRFVRKGELVAAGSPIGITGSTGRVTGEHLHFVIRKEGKAINPLQFLYQVMTMDLMALYSYIK